MKFSLEGHQFAIFGYSLTSDCRYSTVLYFIQLRKASTFKRFCYIDSFFVQCTVHLIMSKCFGSTV
jgi:hypothetical protein